MRLKDEFVALVSHELRTPLASIFGFAELLLDRETLSQRTREFLGIIYHETQRLTNLVSDFLEVGRLEAGQISYHFRPLPLDDALDLVNASLAAQLSVRHRLVYDRPAEPLVVRADSERLDQVLLNLVSNAIKYSPEGGEIHVSVELLGAVAVVAVTDQGSVCPRMPSPTSLRSSTGSIASNAAGSAARGWDWRSASRSSKAGVAGFRPRSPSVREHVPLQCPPCVQSLVPRGVLAPPSARGRARRQG